MKRKEKARKIDREKGRIHSEDKQPTRQEILNQIAKGIGTCPFYKYKVTNRSEIVTCEASHESIAFLDTESFTKFVTKMPFCLEIEFYDCPKYKKKMKATRSDS